MDDQTITGFPFKLDSFEKAVDEIQSETAAQHSSLKELKDRHLKLKEDLKKKKDNLQTIKDKKMHVIEKLKLEEFRMKEMEEKYKTKLELTEEARKAVKEIQDQLQSEKDKQIENLKVYENKMAMLAQCFREGPQHYNRKSMMQKIRKLENASAGLKKDITENQRKIENCLEIFRNIASEGSNFSGSISMERNGRRG
ncbi:probable DNA double-strand break repair Rad50 ATPase isoform X2 [Ischnura elegans]|uniref:probable DNA double-strand break repair Rad50 ATPase isoform X2 n=1 Tax=Ischnura elegans TaxID=197161 RepID=UPI001ED86CC1|nr:probable DNA double-strand break repair Rad50 ATPase isoform X2 [Ischnura elegans]